MGLGRLCNQHRTTRQGGRVDSRSTNDLRRGRPVAFSVTGDRAACRATSGRLDDVGLQAWLPTATPAERGQG